MKALSLLVPFFFSIVAHASPNSNIYATCHGSSTQGLAKRVAVIVYVGDKLKTDAVAVVSETGRERRAYPVSIVGGGDVSVVYAGNTNGGIKLAIRDQGPGYLWLGDGRETFALACQLPQ